MSINNDPIVNANSRYNILTGVTGANPTTGGHIVTHNKETLFDFGNNVGINLTRLDTLKNHTVRTYGMVNADGSRKTGFKWLSQLVDNLFHLSENLERDRLNALRTISEQSTKLYTSLNFKFKLSDVKDLPMETIGKSIEKMETVLQRVNDAKTHNADVKAFEALSTQITDIINQMKHLKLYAVENKILEQLKQGNFSTDTEIFQTLGTLNPKDPSGEEGLSSTANYKEIKTKYEQLCTFKDTCAKLNELQNAKTSSNACAIWSNAKEDLKKYGGDGEIAKLLEQHLDETYTEKIKATSEDIKAIEMSFIKGTEIPKQNLQNARRLCKTINGDYNAEALSTYINDLEKGIGIGWELTKLNSNLSVLKDKSTSWAPEKFNTECQKAEKQIENLDKELKLISDNEITETLGRELLEAKDELGNAQHRVQIKKDLETLQKEIDGLKTNPTTEKETLDDIEKLTENIKNKINASDKDEKQILNNSFGEALRKARETLSTERNRINELHKPIADLRNSLATVKSEFNDFIQNLSKVNRLADRRQLLTKHYETVVLPQTEQKFTEAVPAVGLKSAKAECRNIYDAAKKEMRDMYVDCLKGMK